ncbi:hypothetical protein YPPY103_3251, partial [Yersinia pestis PY-103]
MSLLRFFFNLLSKHLAEITI